MIVPFSKGKGLHKRIEAVPNSGLFTNMAPAAYFIDYAGTADELSELIGYNGDKEVGTGIVVALDRYSGWASKKLWEWTDLHEKNG